MLELLCGGKGRLLTVIRRFLGASLVSFSLLLIPTAFGQAGQSINHATVRHVAWPAPESLAHDLRSKDDKVRFRAFGLLGIPRKEAAGLGSKQEDAQTPELDDVQVRFTHLGKGSVESAVVSAVLDYSYVFGAIGIPGKQGWERIATFSCWCKYEQGDLLNDFVNVEVAGDGENEIVVHSSGGGTGIYEREEERFRLRGNELRSAINFVGAKQECPGGAGGDDMCHLERRWFTSTAVDGLSFLIEAKETVDPAKAPDVAFRRHDFLYHYASPMSCRAFRWSENQVRYVAAPLPNENPCKPPAMDK